MVGGVITSIDDLPRRPGMVRVRAQGKTVATLTRAGAQSLGLEPGIRWTETLEARARAREALERAVTAAARLLKVRARSRHELRERLAAKGHETAAIEAALHSLASSGLVNDAALAEQVVRETARRAPAGAELIRQRLEQRGISRRDAAPALRDAGADEAELIRFARARLRAMPPKLDDAARRRRLAGALARRGFDEEAVETVLQRVLGHAPPVD